MKKIRLVSLSGLLLFIGMISFNSCTTNELNRENETNQLEKKSKTIDLVSSDMSFRVASDVNSLVKDISTAIDEEVIEIVSTEFFKDKDGHDMAYVYYKTLTDEKANMLFVSRKAKLILPNEVVFDQSVMDHNELSKVAPPVKISCGGCSPCRVYYNPGSGDVHCESECCTMTVH